MLRTAARIGIKEVAAAAGVAVSSVSRVIGNHPDVSAEMRARVFGAVRKLGYEPDILAQSLRRGSTRTIGFLVSDISNPLYSEISLGAQLALHEAGYAMVITNTFGGTGDDSTQLRLLQQRRVDGLILSLSDESHPATVEHLKGSDRPFVLLDREIAGYPAAAVLSDHAAAMRTAVRHLIELGHKRIGFIGGSPNVRPTRARALALSSTCEERRGVRAYIENGSFSAAHGEAASEKLLSRRDPPTALLAGGNQILVGVLRTIRHRQLSIPGDVSLVTCDTLPLSEFLTPPLATLERDHRQIGNAAAKLLLQLLLRPALQQQLQLPVSFDPKGSCAPPGG